MKTLFNSLLSGALLLSATVGAYAQNAETAKVPVAIYFPEQVESIPAEAQNLLVSKLTSAAARSGMAATPDFAQFYLTCSATVLDRDVIAGAPTKYRQEVELNFYVVDAFAKKVFHSTSLTSKGVGNSEAKAYIAGFRQLSSQHAALTKFMQETNDRIVEYYEGQCDNIIRIAQSLAKVYKYDEALFRLSLYPEACPSYNRIVDVAVDIYQKYIDDRANRCLAKARAIWNAGQDAAAASEAGQYLAEILPEAACYAEAVALSNEIKERVKSDIDYVRQLEARDNAQAHEARMEAIKAWKEVGIAFGNNQKAHTYKEAWVM